MEIGYREALEQLQSMFQDCDTETIKAVLASNNGHVERTIEDLLKMTSEAGGEEPDDDNLFADYNQNNKPKANRNDDLFGIDDEPKGNRFEDLGIFQDNPSRPKPDSNLRAQQEKADAELAYRLQKEEIAYEKEIERQQSRQQSRRSNNSHQPVGISQQWEFSAPNQQAASRYGQPQGQPQPQMPPQETGEKKKTGIMSKVKTGFSSIFNKAKPKPKGPTHNPGQYAEIDNLDDQQEIYQFSNGGQSNQNMGLHQFQGDNNNNNYEDAPMQLSDILNPRGMSNMKNDSDEDDNNNNRNNNYRNNNGGGISNDHFDFH